MSRESESWVRGGGISISRAYIVLSLRDIGRSVGLLELDTMTNGIHFLFRIWKFQIY